MTRGSTWSTGRISLPPATFYAKAEEGEGIVGRLMSGFADLLPQLALFEWPIVVVLFTLGAVGIWIRHQTADSEDGPNGADHLFAAAWLAGIAYCATSFVLIEPVDPPAFYHQRYILPGLDLIVYEPTTPDTVTSQPGMAPHALMTCQPGEQGTFRARKLMPFKCPTD